MQNRKILLIDDNRDLRENTAEILEMANYTVHAAENGKEGLKLVKATMPDLILCDILMPEIDGYGVLHLLQKDDGLKHIPFIFLTGKTERQDIRKGMEMGADDYITKPFSSTELLNAIEARLLKADADRQLLSIAAPVRKEATSLHEEINHLIRDRNINRYKKRQLIYSEGNHPSKLYYIIKGKVKTFKTSEDGKDLVMDLYKAGDFLGYIAVLEQSTYHENAEAMEETELAIIPKEDFEETLQYSPLLSRKFIQLLASNVSEKEQHLLNIAYSSLRKKVAEALIIILKKYAQPESSDGFTIDITRENLAAIAGTATESLIRTLGDFRNERVLEITNGIITIRDKKKLQQLTHN